MLRLSFPEIAHRLHLGDHLAWPDPRDIDIGNRIDRHLLLGFVNVIDPGAVGEPAVIPLAIEGGRIVDLEEELQQLTIADLVTLKPNFNALGVGAMIAIGGVFDIAARVAHTCTQDPRQFADQILHAPKTAARQHCAFFCHNEKSST